MSFDAWWDAKRRSFGGDDGIELVSLLSIAKVIDEQWLVLNVTQDKIEFLEAVTRP